MLGQLSGEDEAHSSLDLARSHGGLLVVAGQVLGLSGDLVEDILQKKRRVQGEKVGQSKKSG